MISNMLLLIFISSNTFLQYIENKLVLTTLNYANSSFKLYRDEDYDRGKRKKLRNQKHSFGGPNPFQEIATKKTQFKKAKLSHTSSGDRPFRI